MTRADPAFSGARSRGLSGIAPVARFAALSRAPFGAASGAHPALVQDTAPAGQRSPPTLPPTAWQYAADAPTLHALADGQRILIRPMQPADSDAERALVDGLSPASRYHRFHFGLRALSPDLLKRLTADVDQQRHVAFVAESADAPGAGLIGDARYVRSSDLDEAEFALTVADAWQGRGIGRLLLDQLRRHARSRGVGSLYGDVLWASRPMLDLARSAGANLQRLPGDATLLRVRLSP